MTNKRAVPSVAAAMILAAVLTGCARGAEGDETLALTQGLPASAASTAATLGDNEGSDDAIGPIGDTGGTGDTGDTQPTLPPGDPGADAPGTDDPNGDLGGAGTDPEDGAARTTVPASALLDAETVDSVAGAGWVPADDPDPAGTCATPVPASSVATRVASLERPATDGDRPSWLVERVSTHVDRKAAITAVGAIGKRLARCADSATTDPRVGDASVQATVADARGVSSTVTAVAVEGVSFVLSGSGTVTAAQVWAALTDIALGNTCEAAAVGCH